MIFTVLLQIQHEVIIFLLPVNTNKPKFVTFLDKLFLCTTASFIVQISSSENIVKRDAILAQVARNVRKLLFTALVNTNNCYPEGNLPVLSCVYICPTMNRPV